MFTSDDSENGPKLKSNMFSLSGDGFLGAVGRSLNLGKSIAFLRENTFMKHIIDYLC